ncbi:MAG: hypothetical protein ACPG8W_01585 [Candidatus Promineifilaceae bacterium]
MPSHQNSDLIKEKERRSILEAANNQYLSRGFRVVSETGYSVQLVKPRRFNLAVLLLGVLICIAGWPNTIAAQNEETVYLSVDEFGNVMRR